MWMRENRREDANRLTRYSLAPSAITKIELTLTPVACEASSSLIRSEDMQALILIANLYASHMQRLRGGVKVIWRPIPPVTGETTSHALIGERWGLL